MAARNMNLPLLPGYTFNNPIGKEYFGKKQHLSLMGDVCVMNKIPQSAYRPESFYLKASSSEIPSWLLFDKQTLTFDAVFQNYSNGSSTSMKRFVKVKYFLEDGTMKVIEPKTDNSGLYQGTIVSRQRVPLPDDEFKFFEVIDLNIGKEIRIFGKDFLLIDCDKFTRFFLTRLGVKVPNSLDVPRPTRHHVLYSQESSKITNQRVKSSVQFLEFDRKILRFDGFWDDDGVIRKLEILYYLADDTIEIFEVFNTGEKKKPFLRRGPLPKKLQKNLIASYGTPMETYGPSDLAIGAAVNAHGRVITLTDCDPFTKQYYSSKYGIVDFAPITHPIITTPLPKNKTPFIRRTSRQLSPWNGYGSHRDSAGNCDTIDPKAPKCDFVKFLEKDSIGKHSHILRFLARMISDVPDNHMRKFIVSYYLRDDTISVFESRIRNSGFQGGMFFKRNCVVVPGQDMYVTGQPRCYSTEDMWIGNRLTINDHNFVLVNADEYTLKYMEENFHEFDKSNVNLIIDKIKRKLLSSESSYKDFVAKILKYLNPDDNASMAVQHFESILKEFISDSLTEHEYITVMRCFKKQFYPMAYNREAIRADVFTYLKRHLWQDNVRLLEHFKYLDGQRSGYLSKKEVRNSLIANRLPIPQDVLNEMMDVIKINNEGMLDYQDVMDFLNFKLKPPQAIISVPAKSTKNLQKLNPETHIPERTSEDFLVNWQKFNDSLNLNYLLTEKP